MVANHWRLPLAVHLAESAAELELLEYQRGPLRDFLEQLGAWEPEELLGSIEEVAILLDEHQVPRPLFIHWNYLDANMSAFGRDEARKGVARKGVDQGAYASRSPKALCGTIVYCPRTHAAFGHPPHPFREFLARGFRVALGTDSLASNPDLDLLAEARFVYRNNPDVPPATLLRMATLSGAEALGWHDETGSLEPGKSADFVVLPLANTESKDPYQLIFESSLAVEGVMWRGQWRAEWGVGSGEWGVES